MNAVTLGVEDANYVHTYKMMLAVMLILMLLWKLKFGQNVQASK